MKLMRAFALACVSLLMAGPVNAGAIWTAHVSQGHSVGGAISTYGPGTYQASVAWAPTDKIVLTITASADTESCTATGSTGTLGCSLVITNPDPWQTITVVVSEVSGQGTTVTYSVTP